MDVLSQTCRIVPDNRYGIRAAWFATISCVAFHDSTMAQASEARQVEEVIVTAQKRLERIQDVPVPMTLLSAETLVNANQTRIQDYYTKVPGFSLTMLGDVGFPVLVVRGITAGGYNNATVAVTVDDVPFGSSIGAVAADFDPSELAGVEVLRGPQGTLYGASSPGGLLKYTTVDPSTERMSGRLQVGSTSVEDGDEIGYSVRASVNIPVSDTFALRAGGFTRTDPGYIDNPVWGRENVNEREAYGGRLAALWELSETFSVKLSALAQRSERHGEDTAHLLPTLDDLENTDLRNTGWYDQKIQAYSATMTAQLGPIELTSLTGYSVNSTASSLDATPALGTFTQNGIAGFPGFGVRGTAQVSDPFETDKFSQELRLLAPLGDKVRLLFGGFYTDEDTQTDSKILAINQDTGAVVGEWLDAHNFAAFSEWAAFANLEVQITRRFDVQVGGRFSKFEVENGREQSFGPYNPLLNGRPAAAFSSPGVESKDDAATYLLTPRFKITPDLMAYARFASGYRPGGPNTNTAARAAGLPADYGPDTTQNYELGLKGAAFDRLVSFDASVYYIDWKDVQLQLRDPNLPLAYILNVGSAESKGAELALSLRPIANLNIALSGAYNRAELTDVPATAVLRARPGDILPYSPRWSGSLSVDHEFIVGNDATVFIGSSFSYVGERKGRFFTNTLPRQEFPSYTQLDLRAGTTFDSWTVSAFVNNLTDQRGVLRGGRDASLSLAYARTYTQPRTLGVSLAKSF